MAKRTLDEILNAVNAIVGEDNTDDAVLALIEDLTDTITEEAPAPEPDTALADELERVNADLEDMRKRYKDRFFGRVDDPEEESEDETEEEKPDGEKITIKDIFKKKED